MINKYFFNNILLSVKCVLKYFRGVDTRVCKILQYYTLFDEIELIKYLYKKRITK